MKDFKPISISLSPNVEKDDVKLALNLVLRPWLWRRGKQVEILEEEFRKYLGVKYAVAFNSGRSSFYAILKSFGFERGSEILIQAFTCNAVPNPILWADLSPVYVDCNESDFNINAEDLRKKITAKSKAVVVQHTFGSPANLDEIRLICSENNLILIEDCAHSLGAEFKGQKVGSESRAAFFSFSRDKIISSVYGGMAVTNDEKIGKELGRLKKEFGTPSLCWTWQQIWHPVLLHYFILPIYSFLDLGKIFLVLSQALHVLSKAVSWKEKQGQKPDYFPKAMPNAIAAMALNQFSKLEKFNHHREKVAELYYKELAGTSFQLPPKTDDAKNVFLRFTVKHKNAHDIIYKAWHKRNILLGDWYTTPIAPFDTKVETVKYKPGSCKSAEYLAKRTLNLPTHINIKKADVDRIVNFLKNFK